MQARIVVALAMGTVVAAVALVVLDRDQAPRPVTARAAAPGADPALAISPPARWFRGAREDCSTRSEADFPGAYTSPQNLVVGPLVLIGGAYTHADTVREFGGNKFPLLVKSGHVVTVRVGRRAPRARRVAGLAYGVLPQRETTLRDTHRTVTFVACRQGTAPDHSSPSGPSGSRADGTPVTFWSGFFLARRPACVALEVYVDDERSPRRAGLPLGRRCDRQVVRFSRTRRSL